MKLFFKINGNNDVELILSKGSVVVDRIRWKENNDLSQKMLRKIDEILGRKKIGLDKISVCEIMSEVPKNWTSYRIAKSTFDSLKIAKKFKH